MELRFEFERETKNTYRFKESVEDGEEAMVDYPLYIKKVGFKSRPKVLVVTIEVEE